ncbi:hypothetical protein PL11_002690 [Lentilactobacillus curieae]|uniref:Uncharacterized protein n=1 Tax=Lentilactobacillus curieae TaxID=1138822 RepID=A0A1S6QH16_9LACO|nr:hypothetical protein [Lentilactobacillus curieae]AQW20898.1 hypothetical protein PL11_002690 [Lentilactobacillus curieae]
MADSIIVYNQPDQNMFNVSKSDDFSNLDLTEIGLSDNANLSNLVNQETFALVYNGTEWESQTYMQWEDLRINEALKDVKGQYSQPTQDILTQFVASMDIKYQGKKSWVELLNELGKAIEK